jgi:pterin-4a-carbinolamine dehydratase
MNDQWQERIRPARLEKRIEFPDYHALRDFLDRAAEVSERDGLFPDMGFGRDYVNITIHSEQDGKELGSRERKLASELDAILDER